MTRQMRDLEGRAITVMGLGLFGGGAAVARFCARRGARVTVTDLRPQEVLAPTLASLAGHDFNLALGGHRESDFQSADLVVVNPAVPLSSPFLALARTAKVPLTSETALFLENTPATVVAITGTEGKSSTTHFLGQLLATASDGRRVFQGGNIGHSLLDDLDEMTGADVCALELSSYQLEGLSEHLLLERADSPIAAALITNLRCDHLERHKSRAAYIQAKLRLCEWVAPGGSLFLPAGEWPGETNVAPDVRLVRHGGEGWRTAGEGYDFDGKQLAPPDWDESWVGFQQENIHLALCAAHLMGAPKQRLASALAELKGLPHRLEWVGQIDGRRVFDNAVSTTPDSTESALCALAEETGLIVGGEVKDLDLAPLLATARARRARVVIFGAARKAWTARFLAQGLAVRTAAGPKEALALALDLGGSDLLFSPACASFDAYANFKARAEDFLDAARAAGLAPRESVCP
jgi:UDP-N-acetylmuramoylalanine--D-glutamate ligase